MICGATAEWAEILKLEKKRARNKRNEMRRDEEDTTPYDHIDDFAFTLNAKIMDFLHCCHGILSRSVRS